MRTAVLLLLVAGCGPVAEAPARGPSAGTSSAGTGAIPQVSAATVEARVHARTNDARRRGGLRALTTDAALARVARRHSADMAARGFFDHTAPDGSDANARAARDGLTCRVRVGDRTLIGFAENLAQMWTYGRWRETRSVAGVRRTYEARSADEVAAQTVDGWLNSPGHRRNLLAPHATREGVGVSVRLDGAVYVTQILC
jgi:uncharacterized protein YkwD